MRRKAAAVCVLVGVLAIAIIGLRPPAGVVQSTAPAQFSFAAAGDWGNSFPGSTQTNLQNIANSGTSFTLALGDLGYISTGQEQAWCAKVQSVLGSSYPFEVISGNHEDDSRENGWIANYVQYCRDQIGVSKLQGATGVNNVAFYSNGYGAEYYFDYPAGAPLARIIMIGQHLTINGTAYKFETVPMLTWLNATINSAQSRGLWVIVGEHYPCIDAGAGHNGQCGMTTTLEDFLIRRHVDLILTGHEHNYERSKQLGLSNNCATIGVNSYNSNCVVNDGSTGAYKRGAGTVIVIQGTGGGPHYGACSCGDANWFSKVNTVSWGFVKYTVSAGSIAAQFVAVAPSTFTDAFTIGQGVPTHIVSVHPARYFAYGVPGSGGIGNPLLVNVTVYNALPSSQTFTVFLSYGSYSAGSGSLTVPGQANGTGTLLFKVAGLPLGSGQLTASVSLQGSSLSLGVPFQLRLAGNVDGDGTVDILDAAMIAEHYNQTVKSPGFCYSCDLLNDGSIDIFDMAYLALYYLHHYP